MCILTSRMVKGCAQGHNGSAIGSLELNSTSSSKWQALSIRHISHTSLGVSRLVYPKVWFGNISWDGQDLTFQDTIRWTWKLDSQIGSS